MKADRCLPNTLGTDEAKNKLELIDSCQQLAAELCEHKRLAEELSQLNRTLELRVTEMSGELVAINGELISEREKRAEDKEENRLLQADLVRQKDAFQIVSRELDSFSYAISHDLRAPLRHVAGFSQALLDDYRHVLDDTAKGYLDCIVRAQRKMETRIEAILTLSRISRQELRIVSVDLSQMVRECAELLKAQDPERQYVFTIADELTVRADPALMKVVIGNLLENAWKYTQKKELAIIELGRKREGDDTVFYLSDNGAGFDMRYAEKLFGPFQRMHLESDFEGTGIGLAMVQRIIHRHGGKIWADARVDEGATFFFTLAE